ncbi:MAG: type 4a pilus biogenesis protein PilO [Candidatus Nanopelagicales bacterium]|nr:type 4a pilus biogenesis protein PilO [Candidatus Nanopelagicales bacterium]
MAANRRWLLGGAGVAIVVFLILFLLLVAPARNRASALHDDAVAAQDANVAAAARLDQLKRQASEVPAKLAEIQAIQLKLPASLQLPQLVRAITAAAGRSGVTLKSITPAEPSPAKETTTTAGSADLVTVPLGITANGSYAAIKSFVSALEDMERAFFIKSITVSSAGSSDTATESDTGTESDVFSELSVELSGAVFALPDKTLADALASPTPTPAPPAPTSSAAPSPSPSAAPSP